MAGHRECLPAAIRARLLADLLHKPPRREYVQAFTRRAEEGYVVQPHAKRGSAMLTSTVGANSLVVLAEESHGARAGDLVEVIPLAGASL
jgi:molybdopterin molybdotransferase